MANSTCTTGPHMAVVAGCSWGQEKSSWHS